MGGYGAWKLGLGASETFGAAASLSGALDIVGDYERNVRENSQNLPLFSGIFGSAEQLRGSKNDLLALADGLAASGKERPRLYAWCGTEDFLYEGNLLAWEHLNKLGGTEDFLYEGNLLAWEHLNKLGFEMTLEESAGDHQWKYWDAKIQDVLRWWLGTDMDLQ